MAQFLKEETQASLVAAALQVFAEKGFQRASVAEIAAAAGVSTGNVYRYFQDKRALFEAALPDAFVADFKRLLRERVAAARGVSDARRLDAGAPYPLASEALVAFSLQHRLQVILLLSGSRGTSHERVAEELVEWLVASAVSHFRARLPGLKLSRAKRFALVELYQNYLGALVRILRGLGDDSGAREAIESLAHYHLAGLNAFFEG